MSSIVIVSGCPGSGKTTLARALARSHARGLHLDSDVFYRFPAHPIAPTHPDFDHQNTVIMRALARSARVFAEGSYEVVLEGVIGPWFMPLLIEELSADEVYARARWALEAGVCTIPEAPPTPQD